MLVLLPPSETKRDGGATGSSLELAVLSFASLAPERRTALSGLRSLSRNLTAATIGLGLGPTQRFEIDRNRVLGSSPVLPAIERYTGVLYDALEVETLDAAARGFLARTTVIHSALFGLVRADDPIPAYRLSHDSRLPGIRLKQLWRQPVAEVLAAQEGLVLDLRSEANVALGPAPSTANSVFLRTVTRDSDGMKRALNHFNKKGKGEFLRAIARSGIDHPDVASLLDWAARSGIDLLPGARGELDLVV